MPALGCNRCAQGMVCVLLFAATDLEKKELLHDCSSFWFCWHKVMNVAATQTDWVDSSKINCVTCFQYSTELFFLFFLFLKVNIILPSFTALIGLDEYHSWSSVGINCVWDWKHNCCYSQCSVRHLTDLWSWLPGWERDRSWALWILQQI